LQEQLKSAEVKLQEQAHEIEVREADALTDALTGIANRRAFNAELQRRIAEWRRRGTPFCLLMVDVDHFKKFNDQHGHLAGDAVLRGVAQGLRGTARQMDIVARYGGEEFAVLMPVTTLGEAEPGAVRLGAHIAGCQFEFEGKTLKVTVSGGLAQARTDEDEASLIKRADEALYAAKRSGRNCTFSHDGATTRPAGAIQTEAPQSPAAADNQPIANPSATGPSTPDGTPCDPFRTDVQTGLPNRTSFCEEIRRRVAESHRFENKLSLLLVNVDALENPATRLSDQAVELVLRTVAQFLTAGMREMDLVARYYDHVFAVLLPSTPLEQALGVAERLRTAVGRCPLRGKDFEIGITVSNGLAEVTRADDWASFLKRAEAAMQGAVLAGRDNTQFHNGQSIQPYSVKEAAARGNG
jgi:diguanylate cyclase